MSYNNNDAFNDMLVKMASNGGKMPKEDKPASVIGRAVAGGVIAGPAGAIVGALSAVDKNSKRKK